MELSLDRGLVGGNRAMALNTTRKFQKFMTSVRTRVDELRNAQLMDVLSGQASCIWTLEILSSSLLERWINSINYLRPQEMFPRVQQERYQYHVMVRSENVYHL